MENRFLLGVVLLAVSTCLSACRTADPAPLLVSCYAPVRPITWKPDITLRRLVARNEPGRVAYPVGGVASLQDSLRYTAIGLKAGVEGDVVVQFVVDTLGLARDVQLFAYPHYDHALRDSLYHARFVQSAAVNGDILGAGLAEEVHRVLMATEFVPGRWRGKAIPAKMELVVEFRLMDPENPVLPQEEFGCSHRTYSLSLSQANMH